MVKHLLSGGGFFCIMLATNPGVAADTGALSASANLIGTCKFTATPSLAFGVLDQTVTSDANAAGNLQFWCTKGASYTLSDQANPAVGDGTFAGTISNGSQTIPYSIIYNNFSGIGIGKTNPITASLAAKILNSDYANAPAGAYLGTVTFTVAP